ncbi:SCO family protein [Ulvibacter antarcticus]|uniref:Protein SCO1/2 n=1 Tax=Ulvibacter antarcticus TaxID=442714 RepID=A0A3L9YYD7_9FLAO|nr:SCO family protein [Ulvibacter antarcticus]RMA65676.1 protein SCO1/2 [Ulvibacter antarcticus]
MKKQSYIGISFVILVFGIIFVPKIIDRISNGSVVQNDRMSNNENNFDTPKSDELVTISKVPDFKFINQNNDTITNNSYSGKVYIVEFFFTTCPDICPIMNQNMVKVQKAIGENPEFGVASFSIDPTYDTPEVLQKYAENYEITNPNWNLLTGEKTKIFELANEGFKIYASKDEEAGTFAHSGMFALIDKKGNVRSRKDENGNPIIYYNGLEDDEVLLIIEDAKKLLNHE